MARTVFAEKTGQGLYGTPGRVSSRRSECLDGIVKGANDFRADSRRWWAGALRGFFLRPPRVILTIVNTTTGTEECHYGLSLCDCKKIVTRTLVLVTNVRRESKVTDETEQECKSAVKGNKRKSDQVVKPETLHSIYNQARYCIEILSLSHK